MLFVLDCITIYMYTVLCVLLLILQYSISCECRIIKNTYTQHSNNAYNLFYCLQAAWVLKMRALTEESYVDDLENDEDGIVEILLDDEAVAQVARPGTSLRTGNISGPTQGMRPPTHTGRLLTGVVRPGSRGRTGTMEQALKTPRTAQSARPISTAAGMRARLGTASMLSEPGGPFIQLSKLNLNKYAAQPSLAKPLFEYIYYHEHEIPKVK